MSTVDWNRLTSTRAVADNTAKAIQVDISQVYQCTPLILEQACVCGFETSQGLWLSQKINKTSKPKAKVKKTRMRRKRRKWVTVRDSYQR